MNDKTFELFSAPGIDFSALVTDDDIFLEAETCPGSPEGEVFDISDSARQALDIATRIIYAVWLVDPQQAEDRMEMLAEDIPTVKNLLDGYKGERILHAYEVWSEMVQGEGCCITGPKLFGKVAAYSWCEACEKVMKPLNDPYWKPDRPQYYWGRPLRKSADAARKAPK